MKHRVKVKSITIASITEPKPLINKKKSHERILTKAETRNIICERAIQILSAIEKNTH